MTPQSVPATEPRILVAAGSLLARAGLAALLDERGCDVVAQVDGANLDADIDQFGADLLVIDMGWDGETMLTRLDQIESDLPILALAADVDEESLAPLMLMLREFSQFALLTRDSDPDMIVAALHALDNGLIALDPAFASLLDSVIQPDPAPLPSSLTSRENEVLQLLAQGLTNRALALQLGITQHTVKFHVNAIMSKLDAQSRTEAVVRATQLGMIVL